MTKGASIDIDADPVRSVSDNPLGAHPNRGGGKSVRGAEGVCPHNWERFLNHACG